MARRRTGKAAQLQLGTPGRLRRGRDSPPAWSWRPGGRCARIALGTMGRCVSIPDACLAKKGKPAGWLARRLDLGKAARIPNGEKK